MKKIALFAVLAIAAFASCNKELSEPAVIVPEGDQVYTSFLAGGEEISKVSLNFADNKIVKWLDTDILAVFDGVGKNNFTVKQGSNTGASAVFEGTVDANATTLYAVYPASAAQALNGSSLSVTVPAAQVIGTGECADPTALVAVASAAKGSAMAFKQVCGLLKISFAAEDIRKITISGTALAGTATVAADGTLSSVTDPAGSITLTHADGLFPPGTYYVAVLPGTTAAGQFSISLSNGVKAGLKEASSAVSFARCKGLDAGILDGLPMYTVISTMAELFSWNSTRVVNDESEPENVMLAADIDMEDEAWTPKDFKGVFDGRGHKLYNLNVVSTSNACLFNTITGTVKNLTVGTSDGERYDGVSRLIQENPEDTAESWRYAGLFTRLSKDAVIDNVVSFVPVTVASSSISKTRVGGLVAIVAGAATIKNCENHGTVKNLASSPLAAGAVGGIVGWTDAALTAENVCNFCDVTVANASTSYIGGILSGENTSVGGSSFSNCFNKGNISVTSAGKRGMCIGGIVGEGANTTFSQCDNFGAISTVCDGELKVGGILGRAYIGCTLSNCTNGNEATITFNPDTFESQAFIGGIVGNAPAANTSILTISSCKNYAPLTAIHRNVGNLGGIAGFLNITSGQFVIENCENWGAISRTLDDKTKGAAPDGNNAYAAVAGIAASLAAGDGMGSIISGCVNNAKVSTNTNAGSTNIRIAGITAWPKQYTEVKDCENKGDIEYRMGDAAATGSTIHEGGIVGHLVKGSSVTGCSNSGKIFSDRKQVNRVGGIVGTINSSAVYSCTNTGKVEVDVPSGTLVQYWQAVGGIAGFAEGTTGGCTRAIKDCVNRGAVSASVNAKPNYEGRYGVGGIIGQPFSTYTISGNKNYGSVYAENTNEDIPYSYAGGVVGFDDDVHASVQSSVITSNSNYGEVTNGSSSAQYSAAGGLFGRIAKATGVTGSSFGAVNGPGAGAVAGVNATDLTVTLCDAVTVNGTAKASAASEADWLCPSNTGTINPSYVAHSANE